MYKIIGIGKASRTRVTMYFMLSFEQALEICEGFNWQWTDYAGNCWDLDIVEQ